MKMIKVKWLPKVKEMIMANVGNPTSSSLKQAMFMLLREASFSVDTCIKENKVDGAKKLYEVLSSIILHFHISHVRRMQQDTEKPTFYDAMAALVSLLIDLKVFTSIHDVSHAFDHTAQALREALTYLAPKPNYLWDVVIQSSLLKEKSHADIKAPLFKRIMEATSKEAQNAEQFVRYLLATWCWLEATTNESEQKKIYMQVFQVPPPEGFSTWFLSLPLKGLPKNASKPSYKHLVKLLFRKKLMGELFTQLCEILTEDVSSLIEKPGFVVDAELPANECSEQSLFVIDCLGGKPVTIESDDELEPTVHGNLNATIVALPRMRVPEHVAAASPFKDALANDSREVEASAPDGLDIQNVNKRKLDGDEKVDNSPSPRKRHKRHNHEDITSVAEEQGIANENDALSDGKAEEPAPSGSEEAVVPVWLRESSVDVMKDGSGDDDKHEGNAEEANSESVLPVCDENLTLVLSDSENLDIGTSGKDQATVQTDTVIKNTGEDDTGALSSCAENVHDISSVAMNSLESDSSRLGGDTDAQRLIQTSPLHEEAEPPESTSISKELDVLKPHMESELDSGKVEDGETSMKDLEHMKEIEGDMNAGNSWAEKSESDHHQDENNDAESSILKISSHKDDDVEESPVVLKEKDSDETKLIEKEGLQASPRRKKSPSPKKRKASEKQRMDAELSDCLTDKEHTPEITSVMSQSPSKMNTRSSTPSKKKATLTPVKQKISLSGLSELSSGDCESNPGPSGIGKLFETKCTKNRSLSWSKLSVGKELDVQKSGVESELHPEDLEDSEASIKVIDEVINAENLGAEKLAPKELFDYHKSKNNEAEDSVSTEASDREEDDDTSDLSSLDCGWMIQKKAPPVKDGHPKNGNSKGLRKANELSLEGRFSRIIVGTKKLRNLGSKFNDLESNSDENDLETEKNTRQLDVKIGSGRSRKKARKKVVSGEKGAKLAGSREIFGSDKSFDASHSLTDAEEMNWNNDVNGVRISEDTSNSQHTAKMFVEKDDGGHARETMSTEKTKDQSKDDSIAVDKDLNFKKQCVDDDKHKEQNLVTNDTLCRSTCDGSVDEVADPSANSSAPGAIDNGVFQLPCSDIYEAEGIEGRENVNLTGLGISCGRTAVIPVSNGALVDNSDDDDTLYDNLEENQLNSWPLLFANDFILGSGGSNESIASLDLLPCLSNSLQVSEKNSSTEKKESDIILPLSPVSQESALSPSKSGMPNLPSVNKVRMGKLRHSTPCTANNVLETGALCPCCTTQEKMLSPVLCAHKQPENVSSKKIQTSPWLKKKHCCRRSLAFSDSDEDSDSCRSSERIRPSPPRLRQCSVKLTDIIQSLVRPYLSQSQQTCIEDKGTSNSAELSPEQVRSSQATPSSRHAPATHSRVKRTGSKTPSCLCTKPMFQHSSGGKAIEPDNCTSSPGGSRYNLRKRRRKSMLT